MKFGEQMRLFDDRADVVDSADRHEQEVSAETVPRADVPLDQCTGPLFCPRCGMPCNWASAGEFCVCGARRCVSCGDA